MSRKDDAAEMLLDGDEPDAVVAATGLQAATVENIAARLDAPILGDNSFRGTGRINCKLCGRSVVTHPLAQRCVAGADF